MRRPGKTGRAWVRLGQWAAYYAVVAVLLGACGGSGGLDSGDSPLATLLVRAGGGSTPLAGATLSGIVTVIVDSEGPVGEASFSLMFPDDAGSEVLTSSSSSSLWTLDTTALSDGSYHLRVQVSWPNGTSRELAAGFTIANADCGGGDGDEPAPGAWRSIDIGDVGIEGSTEFCTAGLPQVVRASGDDVWSERDAFRFTYRAVSGDAALLVRVEGIEATHEWTKVGVMVRGSLDVDAPNAFLLLTESNGAVFQRRSERGGSTSDMLSDGSTMWTPDPRAPWWLRIERVGSTVVGSHSPDGTEWQELGRVDVGLADTALIGTAVTSGIDGVIATGLFSNVSLVVDGGDTVTPPDDPSPDPEPDPDPDPEPDPDPDPDPVPPPLPGPIEGPTVSASYQVDGSSFVNPERGWYVERRATEYGGIRAGGVSLVMRYVRLDDYRTQPLPSSLLSGLESDFDAAGYSGAKRPLIPSDSGHRFRA